MKKTVLVVLASALSFNCSDLHAGRFGSGFAVGALTGVGATLIGTSIARSSRQPEVVVVQNDSPQDQNYAQYDYEQARQAARAEILALENRNKELALREKELELQKLKTELALSKK